MTKPITAGLVLAILFTTISTMAADERPGSISGRVVDAEDTPAAGVAVVLCQHGSGVAFAKGATQTFTDAMQTGSGQDLDYVVTDEKGLTTVRGLPEGKVYLALFAADSLPGWGAGEVQIEPNRTTVAYVPIVVGWSNGQHDPPQRLKPLFEEVKSLILEKEFSVPGFLEASQIHFEAKGKQAWSFQQQICPHLEKRLELPTGSKTTVADFMAVVGYVQLGQSVARREEQRKRRAELARMEAALPEADRKGSYQEAFFDLYRELGENYPCFELKEIDWKAVGEELLPRAEGLETDEEFALLCVELVARLEDSHAYLSKGTAELPSIPFPRWDPGFACLIDDRDKPVVYYVDTGGPAEIAGLEVGMTVLSVNGQPAAKAMEACMKQVARYQGYSSRRYLEYQAARWFVRQMQRGADVAVKVQDTDGKAHTFEMPATLDVRYLPRLPVPIKGVSDSAGVSWTMLPGEIGYIYVRRIRADLIEKLDRAVGELKDAQGLIVDVRGNSGGGFDAGRAHRNFAPDDDQEPQRPRFDRPVALLIDARCISAGEGWASWFIAKGRARVFGQTTAGASSRKKTYSLKNGLYKVTFPVKAYHGFLQRPIERRGLEPEVALRQSARDLARRRDAVLEAAKRYLLELDTDQE